MEKKYDIYLSYSRKDQYKARVLASALKGRGYRTFLDFNSLLSCDFEKVIIDAIENSSVFIFLYPSDGIIKRWLKEELLCAKMNNKRIIPIAFNDNYLSKEPLDIALNFIKELKFFNIDLGGYYEQSIDCLVDAINCELSDVGREKVNSNQIIKVISDRSCRVYQLVEIGVAYEGISTQIQVPEGNHKLMFVDLERESVRVEKNVSMNVNFQEVDIQLLEKYKKSTNSDEIDVFISYNSDDLDYAKEIAEMCKYAGKSYFLADESLKKRGNSAYKIAIDKALAKCRHLVVVVMTLESLKSAWVEYEYQTFHCEKLSGRKDGNLITITGDGITDKNLPIPLSSLQFIPYAQKEDAIEYFK